MSRTSILNAENRTPDVSSRPKVYRRPISQARGSTKLAAVACSSRAAGTVRPHRSEGNTICALMELALPKFDGLGDRPTQAHKPWIVSTDLPASSNPVCSTDLVRSPDPCLDDAEESVKPSDISVTLLCDSEDGHTPVNSDLVVSDEDLQTAQDRVIGDRLTGLVSCLRVNYIPDGRCLWDTQRIVQMSGCSIPLVFSHRLQKSSRKQTSRNCQPPVPPR